MGGRRKLPKYAHAPIAAMDSAPMGAVAGAVEFSHADLWTCWVRVHSDMDVQLHGDLAAATSRSYVIVTVTDQRSSLRGGLGGFLSVTIRGDRKRLLSLSLSLSLSWEHVK